MWRRLILPKKIAEVEFDSQGKATFGKAARELLASAGIDGCAAIALDPAKPHAIGLCAPIGVPDERILMLTMHHGTLRTHVPADLLHSCKKLYKEVARKRYPLSVETGSDGVTVVYFTIE